MHAELLAGWRRCRRAARRRRRAATLTTRLGTPSVHPSRCRYGVRAQHRVTSVLILLPPSEGKTLPASRASRWTWPRCRFPELEPHRAEVLDALVALCTTDEPAAAAEVLGLGTTQTDDVAAQRAAVRGRRRRARTGSTAACSTRPSTWRRSTGAGAAPCDVLAGGHLGPVRAAAARPTGSRPTGSPATCRCPGSARSRRTGAAASTTAVRAAAGRGLVVDLRSSTYASFWRPAPDLARKVVTVRVLHEVDGAPQGRLALQQGHQGPDRARAARGRRGAAAARRGSPTTSARSAGRSRRAPAGRHGTRLDVVVSDL